MNPSLLLNTFISETPLSKIENRGKGGSWINTHYDDLVARKIIYPYRKLDIFKYSLISYSHINWLTVDINFDSESNSWNKEILDLVNKYFKNATVNSHRILNRSSFLEYLNILKSNDVTWVFYSPNHDHPMNSIIPLNFDSLIDVANELRGSYPDAIVSISYSHHLENISALNVNSLFHGINNIFPKLIFNGLNYAIVRYPRFSPDSIQIFHIADLIDLFKSTSTKEIRRTECMIDIFTNIWKTHLLILPKVEFCRHFDSYFHLDNLLTGGKSVLDYIPPLMIPNGIFDDNIVFEEITDTSILLKNIDGISVALKAGKDIVPFFWKMHSQLTPDQINHIDNFNAKFLFENTELKISKFSLLKRKARYIKSLLIKNLAVF